ncbi:CLUMA_CG017747, isoform A [Clunio marinus]|uniref:CLUMA_CG017747, isoform A n=1 Tax=Clunio marinus TaxID=568069 RepID=A0A1J1IWM1_9DIPT|nr:CLUMA_CG017747, isoform A [Clunio marinus]
MDKITNINCDDANSSPMAPEVPESGYLVKKSKETIDKLERENFNLKLKYFLLNRRDKEFLRQAANVNFDFFEMFEENEALKMELSEKNILLKSALDVINQLEDKILSLQIHFENSLAEHDAVVSRSLKNKSKSRFYKKVQIKFSPSLDIHQMEVTTALLTDNTNLLKKLTNMKAKLSYKSQTVDELLKTKIEMEKNLYTLKADKNDYKTKEKADNLIKSNNVSGIIGVQKENEELKRKNFELETTCEKLRRVNQELEFIITEQNELMKQLNKTIEGKNEEILEYKDRLDMPACSSSSSIYIAEDIKLIEDDLSKISRQYPFHNPLFGQEFEMHH